MRHFVLLMILVTFASGCGVRTTRSVPTSQTKKGTAQNSSDKLADFAGRLEAAQSIFDSNKRDAALAKVAADAATAGEGEIAKQAIQKIFSSSAKDEAAYNAAIGLTKAGKSKEAKAVADQIFDSNRKDAALAKIAEGG